MKAESILKTKNHRLSFADDNSGQCHCHLCNASGFPDSMEDCTAPDSERAEFDARYSPATRKNKPTGYVIALNPETGLYFDGTSFGASYTQAKWFPDATTTVDQFALVWACKVVLVPVLN